MNAAIQPLLNEGDRTTFLVASLVLWFIVLAFIAVAQTDDEEDN